MSQLVRKPAPPPGVYPDIPFIEYLAWEAASSSRLSLLQRSAAHLRASLESQGEDTKSLRIGRAAHAAVLEPEVFRRDYACLPEGDGRTKVVKEARELIEAEGRVGLSVADYGAAMQIRLSVVAHRSAGPLIEGEGRSELSLVWIDPVTGVTCKARHDRHSPVIAGGAVIDLKTTRDASPASFARSIFNYGYHRQGALYLNGAQTHGLPCEHYVIIAVENTEPHACAVYRLDEAAIVAGQQEVDALLYRYARCIETNEWPGYPSEVQDIALPEWAWGASQRLVEGLTEEVST